MSAYPLALWVILAGVFGLAIGSFLNVVICRVPAGESVISPPSHCPSCGNTIRTRHNVPVLGWLLLRGRCADCDHPISPRYPLVEATTALLFVVVTVRIAQLHLDAALPAYLYLAAAGLALISLTNTETTGGPVRWAVAAEGSHSSSRRWVTTSRTSVMKIACTISEA